LTWPHAALREIAASAGIADHAAAIRIRVRQAAPARFIESHETMQRFRCS